MWVTAVMASTCFCPKLGKHNGTETSFAADLLELPSIPVKMCQIDYISGERYKFGYDYFETLRDFVENETGKNCPPLVSRGLSYTTVP